MALPTGPTPAWLQSTDFPSQLFERNSNDYRLYEEDDEFALSIEMPGFDPEEIAAKYNNGILEVRLPIRTEAAITGKQIEIES